MSQDVRLSKREMEVVTLLLQGKSNKQIAASLEISIRTVEFHLKNIYAKFQVTSRIELILKLGNATGKFEIEKLGYSTVDRLGKSAENRDRINPRLDWTISFRDAISAIGQELEMKNLLNSKHVRVGVLRRVFLGALFGTGLSPFLIIPLMFIVVLPLGKLAEWLGLIDPATMPGNVATLLTAIIMMAIWLIVGLTIGITLLFVTIKKPEPPMVQAHASENGS